MNAAINGGVITYASYEALVAAQRPSVWSSISGTSAATPEMAALVALAGQRASDILGKSVGIGSLNRILYAVGAQDFHDIVPETFGAQNQVVVDNNGCTSATSLPQVFGATSETPVEVPGYTATPGYDMASGLGSPIAERLVEDIAQTRAAEARMP